MNVKAGHLGSGRVAGRTVAPSSPSVANACRTARTQARVATVDAPRIAPAVEELLKPVNVHVDNNQVVRQGDYEARLVELQVWFSTGGQRAWIVCETAALVQYTDNDS